MLSDLGVLLKRYYVSYFRSPKRLLSDILIMLITIPATYYYDQTSAFFRQEGPGSSAGWSFVLSIVICAIMGEIVTEKSSNIKEYVKLNGVSSFTYQIYLIIITLVRTMYFEALLVGGHIYMYGSYSSGMNVAGIVEGYFIISLEITGIILVLSTFFSDSRTAAILTGLICFTLSYLQMITLTINGYLELIYNAIYPLAAKQNIIYYSIFSVPLPDQGVLIAFGASLLYSLSKFNQKKSEINGVLNLSKFNHPSPNLTIKCPNLTTPKKF